MTAFNETAVTLPTGRNPQFLLADDVNGDGITDLITANANDDNVSVLLGSRTGDFSPASTFAVGARPGSVALGDFNGDGNPDIVAGNQIDSTVSVLLGNGNGGFARERTFAAGGEPLLSAVAVANGPLSVAVGDINNDGNLDIVTTNPDSTVSALLGNGNGRFAPQRVSAVGTSQSELEIGDFNNDGNLDIVTANFFGAISVLLGNVTAVYLCRRRGPSGARH